MLFNYLVPMELDSDQMVLRKSNATFFMDVSDNQGNLVFAVEIFGQKIKLQKLKSGVGDDEEQKRINAKEEFQGIIQKIYLKKLSLDLSFDISDSKWNAWLIDREKKEK